MKFNLPYDFFGNPHPPEIYLCTQGGAILGVLPAYKVSGAFKWNQYSDVSLSVDRHYVDIITGESVVHPLFDKIEAPRQILLKDIGYYVIQDVDTSYESKDTKNISCFSVEYNLSSKYIDLLFVNTGEVDSLEVMYEYSQYGPNATQDDMYTKARESSYDEHGKYFHKVYENSTRYTYEQIQIANEDEYSKHFGPDVPVGDVLYIHGYSSILFYDRNDTELSLLHHIFKYIPGWTIGDVDYSLWYKVRKMSEDRINVYDLLTNKIADIYKCVVVFDTINKRVNFYEEENDGLTEDGAVNSRFETDVYISRANLATQVDVKYSCDDIKTRLKVSGADDIDIREVNLGRNYIMNLDYYHSLDWMEQDLLEAYDDYLLKINGDPNSPDPNEKRGYIALYSDAVQARVAAYNKWNDIMNAVPADGNVVLIGDPFKKLYCIETLYEIVGEFKEEGTPTYYVMREDGSFVVANHQPTADNFSDDIYYVPGDYEANRVALIKTLNLYHVDEDVDATKTDNILLRLRNTDGDVATLRIYDPHKQIISADEFDPNAQYYNRIETHQSTEKKTYKKINKNNIKTPTDLGAELTKGAVYTNDYRIKITVVSASTGLETITHREIKDWIEDNLRVYNFNGNSLEPNNSHNGLGFLDGYKISIIGTMGAYLVLAKNEADPKNLQDYGVKLLQEKHETYATIFQTQTEAMYSQEKYQCVISDEAPTGDIPTGTRWLDSNSIPIILYEFTDEDKWKKVDDNVGEMEQYEYENYQRYLDNFNKLKAAQEVLLEKEKQATYMRDGYSVTTRSINLNDYELKTVGNTEDWYKGGESLDGSMKRVAQEHFNIDATAISGILDVAYDENTKIAQLAIYTFTVPAYPDDEFVVYINGKTPYVSYVDSVGVCQMWMNYYRDITELEKFFTEDQWIRLSPLIREDEFNDSNLLLTGYESEAERLKIYEELLVEASKELKTLAQPSLEFSMDIGNIMALPEFKPLWGQFDLGNFIRIELYDGLIKKARLLEVQLSFEDLSDFSCTFGNLVTNLSEIDRHADLMKQAISAGKQVATSSSSWQQAVDKSNKIEEAINNGLKDAAIQIGSASGQSITWDNHGIWGKKLVDGTTDQYEPQQFRMTNNQLVFSNDGFQTAKSVMGEFTVDGQTRYGLLADACIAGYIEGATIKGGHLEIGGTGGTFIVSEDGSVQIKAGDGTNAYASKTDVDVLQDARRFHIALEYTGSTVFSNPNDKCTITAHVFSWDEDITDVVVSQADSIFTWNGGESKSGTWVPTLVDNKKNVLIIGKDDVEGTAQISCEVQFNDENI